ncbi:MAG: rRNA (uracil1939-C5)-methyltransferase [Patescibacteria group bacterium]|nr:rRNA (uracil1939-C5)-methyltransferase [Patescibacteria group bacterium]
MAKKPLPQVELTLERIIGGGQTIGTLDDGKKCLVWGGLPGERVVVQLTKKKSSYVEGVVTEVIEASSARVAPRDPDSYLSTSPWQIMDFASENHYKAALIEEAFELHDIVLPEPINVWSDGRQYEYRNKVEYSFWYDTEREELDLAFFRRGTHGKITVQDTSLASPAINNAAKFALQTLRDLGVDGRSLKTLLIRSNDSGEIAWQLYVKDQDFDANAVLEKAVAPEVICAEIIYSNPKSPASVITERLAASSDRILTDTILDVPFRYATEGFFQINIPVYEQALTEMQQWVKPDKPVVDLYSGVGSIGLTIGGDNVTLVELNEHAVREMEQNIEELGKTGAKAILAASENALDYISADATIIVDPPRAGLHEKVVEKLIESRPKRIIYLSCNPVTQARDVARMAEQYGIRHHIGYNFFPRTPHIEHLVILDAK